MAKTTCRNRLRVFMADKCLTNTDLATKMNLSEVTISRWRSNRIQPSVLQLVELAEILKVDIKDLLEINHNEENRSAL